MNSNYEILEWDSNFFGFKVGSVQNPDLSTNKLTEILELLKDLKVELIYFASEKKLTNLNDISDFYDIKLVDEKTTLVKKIDHITTMAYDKRISEFEYDYPEKKLFELAIESGIYSRFHRDKRIKAGKYRELYKLWIVNSINKTLAKQVLVSRENNEIAGFVTIGEYNERADIGIIAVDAQNRGKGIGKSLMYAAEKWSKSNKYETIQVVTQGDNLPALKLYSSCGYSIDKVKYFYHIWKR